jgi:hypothetical protein
MQASVYWLGRARCGPDSGRGGKLPLPACVRSLSPVWWDPGPELGGAPRSGPPSPQKDDGKELGHLWDQVVTCGLQSGGWECYSVGGSFSHLSPTSVCPCLPNLAPSKPHSDPRTRLPTPLLQTGSCWVGPSLVPTTEHTVQDQAFRGRNRLGESGQQCLLTCLHPIQGGVMKVCPVLLQVTQLSTAALPGVDFYYAQ